MHPHFPPKFGGKSVSNSLKKYGIYKRSIHSRCPHTTDPPQWLQPVPVADQPGGKSLSLTNQGSTTTITDECTLPMQEVHLECPAQVNGEAVPLDPTGHLLSQAPTPPSLEDIAV